MHSVTLPELCSVSSSLPAASLYNSSRGSISEPGASGPVQYQRGQHAASRHRSAGLATSAVRLRRKGSQPQRKPAHILEEVSVQQISTAEGTSDSTGSNGMEPKGPRSLPYQQSAESAAEVSAVSAQQAGQQTQQAIRQQSQAAGGIQATDWLTDNAPWVEDQTPPSDGPAWPSDVRILRQSYCANLKLPIHLPIASEHHNVCVTGAAGQQKLQMHVIACSLLPV